MRSEKQIYDAVLDFAWADERIRMVTVEGSRTNPNIVPDDFSDYVTIRQGGINIERTK